MNQKFLVGIIIALAIACVYVGSRNSASVNEEGNIGGAGFSTRNHFYLESATGGAKASSGEGSATTSPFYFSTSDTASTTATGFSERGKDLSLDLIMLASTTASGLVYNMQYSHNGIDWFDEGCTTATSNVLISHGASPCYNTWVPATTTVQKKHIFIENVRAKYFRFKSGMIGANGSLWVMATPSEETPN